MILGVLGLLGVAIGLPMMVPWAFFGGGGCSLAALIIGLIARESGGPAKAGMVLGLLGVLMTGAVYFLFLGTREGPPPSTVPIEVKADPKLEAAPVK